MLNSIRRIVRSRAWWVRFQELRREGCINVLSRWRVERDILRTVPVRTDPTEGGASPECEVHILVWDRDHLMGLWAAKSFYASSGVNWPLFWHQGGSLSARAVDRLRQHFPDSRLVAMCAADRTVNAALDANGLTHLRAARTRAFMLRKLVDPVLLGRSPYLLLLDTDVLFFERPTELLDAIAFGKPVGVFNRDQKCWYTVSQEVARERFGIELPDRLNAGLGLVPRRSLDLDLADRWLGASPGARYRNRG